MSFILIGIKFPCSVYVDNMYGVNDVFLFRLGKKDVESISKLVFTSDEFHDLHNSVDALKAHFRKIVSSI